MIRPATVSDLPALIEMGTKFHAASPVADLQFDPTKFEAAVRAMLDAACVVVCEIDGEVRGMAAAVAGETWFGPAKCAQEMFWWSEGCGSEAHGMRTALEDWARASGCAHFGMICLENERAPVLARVYRRAGYRPTEHHFMRAL